MLELQNRAVLQPFIQDGRIRYDKLRDFEGLEKLIIEIETSDPNEMTEKEAYAFWLNAYNIITLKAVLEKLEIDNSWKGITSKWKQFVFFVWNKHTIGLKKMSLYYLENKILRKKYQDPRIHFAINCGSKSCPFLPDLLFEAETLDDYLEELSYNFINEQKGVILKNNTLYISRIFKLYSKDFGGENRILSFVRKYWRGESISENVVIEFQDYDWNLNQLSNKSGD